MAIFPLEHKFVESRPDAMDALMDHFPGLKDISREKDKEMGVSFIHVDIPGVSHNQPVLIHMQDDETGKPHVLFAEVVNLDTINNL